jgi:hemolysin activation/secretion protein
VIGGGQSVRGYRQNARAGDNGVKFTLEDRFILERGIDGNPSLQIAPFFDLGYIWNADHNPNTPNSLQRQKLLAGLGIGGLWRVAPGFDLRLDYAFPLVNLDDRGQNAQDDGLYFNVSWHIQ